MSTEDEIRDEIWREIKAALPVAAWSVPGEVMDTAVRVAARRAGRDRAEGYDMGQQDARHDLHAEIERLRTESLEAQETIQGLRDAAQQSHESIVVRQEEIERLRAENEDLGSRVRRLLKAKVTAEGHLRREPFKSGPENLNDEPADSSPAVPAHSEKAEEGWQPGDPVYREPPSHLHCPCGTFWPYSSDGPEECSECGETVEVPR